MRSGRTSSFFQVMAEAVTIQSDAHRMSHAVSAIALRVLGPDGEVGFMTEVTSSSDKYR